MTPLREAFGLPALFLTTALLAGLRMGETVRLVPPPLLSLVLALLLVGALTRAGALLPHVFLGGHRTLAENLSGIVVLLTLFVASAQSFTLVTPDAGLLHVLFGTFFFIQLLTTLAAVDDRRGMLRSIAVLLGSAFVLRFIVLESLYAPDTGALKRVLTALMEGVSLGSLHYEPNRPLTGYVGFVALALYLTGLFLLSPAVSLPPVRQRRSALRTRHIGAIVCAVAVSVSGSCRQADAPIAPAAADSRGTLVSTEVRERALASARVWHERSGTVAASALGENPPGGLTPDSDVTCRFVVEAVGGTTPKFNCALPDGEVVKVKYGDRNPELHAEVAATRLLSALGFFADRMYVVKRVRCAGCPPIPFTALRCYAESGLKDACFAGGLDFDKTVTFDTAVVERRLEGRAIETADTRGWAWFELDKIDPDRGGSPREEVDALRLLAVLLAHWDNKAENQRLLCPPGADRPDGSCEQPLAVVQDVGATFGPLKVDLVKWRETPVWVDAGACRVSMESLPYGGGTFPETRISEEGRRFLLDRLEALTPRQIEELFVKSRITTLDGVTAESRNPAAWVAAFQKKVNQIRDAGPCPAAAELTSAIAR